MKSRSGQVRRSFKSRNSKQSLPMPAWMAVRIEDLRASFWALPGLMVVGGIIAGVALPWFDEHVFANFIVDHAGQWGIIFDGDSDAAREVLSTVAGSALTVASVVFTVTIATLAMAAGQYGPRLLRQFMADRGNQFTLGSFVATFSYCLVALRAIPSSDFTKTYVPHLTITLALFLALLSIGVLIWFIHHMAQRMRPSLLIGSVGRSLESSMASMHTNRVGEDGTGCDPETAIDLDDTSIIRCEHVGYVEAVATVELFELAVENDLRLKLLVRPGTFVFDGTALLRCYPKNRIDEDLREEMRDSFRVSDDRTMAQDVEFGIDQISEMAVRALSPGINDPRTAMTCVNRLGSVLARQCGREPICPVRMKDDIPRLIIQVPTFGDMIGTAFNGIRLAAERSFTVQLRLIEVLTMIGRFAVNADQRTALQKQVTLVRQSAEKDRLPGDLETLNVRCSEADRVLRGEKTEEESYRE